MNFNKFLQISKNYRSKSKAFTLIEMLVTISIITLLTTMVISYSHVGQSINNLRRAAEQLMTDLKRAQSLSMLSFGPAAEYKGWGIEINEEGNGYSLIYKTDDGFETESSTSFRKNIYIIDGEVDNEERNEKSLGKKFLFIPPEPTAVYIESGSIEEEDVKSNQVIILQLSAPDSPQYKVIISSTGMIHKELNNE